MNLFPPAAAASWDADFFGRNFELKWLPSSRGGCSSQKSHAGLIATEKSPLIKGSRLVSYYTADFVLLTDVLDSRTVYRVTSDGLDLARAASSAVAMVGRGKVGYIGDVKTSKEAQDVLLAVCMLKTEGDDDEHE